MPEVVLQDYLEEIDQLIDESRLGEAVRHCRYLLEQFPRHVDTYRLLGKALLEQNEFNAASDVFQRVLSTDPEDFIAHAGMAIVYKHENRLKEAIWHMERAFEMDPYNPAIQEALKDLYGRRDGLPPAQLALTRGALSRLYVKGELYTQAIVQLNALLAEDRSRIDLQMLLAEALWRDEQRVDAVEICHDVLEKLPYCTKANAIVGEAWLVTDRVDEAQKYLQRVSALTLPAKDVLDDDSPLARLFQTEGATSLPAQMVVERLSEEKALAIGGEMADWVQELYLGSDDDSESADLVWLEALQGEDVAEKVGSGDDEAVIDWLRDVAEQETRGDHEQADSEISGNQADIEVVGVVDDAHDRDDEDIGNEPDDAGALENPSELSPDNISNGEEDELANDGTRMLSQPTDHFSSFGELREETDWEAWLENETDEVHSLTSQEDSSDSEEVHMGATEQFGMDRDDSPEEESPDLQSESHSDEQGDGFDWLSELGDDDAAGENDSVNASEFGAEGLPDWLSDASGVSGDSGESLNWLEQGEDDGMHVDDSSGVIPDWLRDDPTTSDVAADSSDEEDLSWLDQIAAGEGAAIEEPPTLSWPDVDVDDGSKASGEWLDDETSPEATSGVEEPEIEEVTLDVEEEEATFEMDVDLTGSAEDDLEALDEVPDDLEGAMAWLEQLAANQGAPAEELPSLSETGESDGDFSSEAPEELEEAMAWLEDLAGEADEHEPELIQFEDEVESEAPPLDEEVVLDEASDELDWLQDVVETPAEDQEEGDAEAELALEEPAMLELDDVLAEDDDDALDWLDGITADDLEGEASLLEMEEPEFEEAPVESELDAEAEFTTVAVDEDDTGEAVSEVDEAPEDPDEAMAWLEQLAANQGAPIDELPSVQEVSATSETTEDFAAAETGAESLEATEEVEDSSWEELDWLEDVEDEIDVDEAWLDELAEAEDVEAEIEHARASIDQSIAEETAAQDELGEDSLQDEAPEDLDEALAWLEQLAARQGTSLDELPSVDELSDGDQAPVGEMAELDEIPDDPDAALAWLESLAGEEESDDGPSVVDEPTTPAAPQDVVAARAEAEAILLNDLTNQLAQSDAEAEAEILDDVPDDPDETIAWLERLAARQGAPLEELPSVDFALDEDDVATPDWIAREAAEEPDAAFEAPAMEVDLEQPDDAFGIDEAEYDEPVADQRSEVKEFEDELSEDEGDAPSAADELLAEDEALMPALDLVDEEIEESLPEWLSFEGDSNEAFEWDETAPDVAGWLQAEEEATQHELKIPSMSAREAQPEVEVAVEHAAPDITTTEPLTAQEPVELLPAAPDMDADQLADARQAVESGDHDAALEAYEALLNAGQGLEVIIADLEVASSTIGTKPRLRRLLGDAYMRNGQLQKALDVYRGALDLL